MNKKQIALLAGASLLAVGAFVRKKIQPKLPKGAIPVGNLDPEKYVGKWYEIARFDFFFEKDVDNTTAEYTLNPNGTLNVVNRGFNYKKNQWQESTAKARFAGPTNKGMLEVSFFGPFYSPYNIIQIDGDYEYALVVGQNTDYIWFLSRTPEMPEDVINKYTLIAQSLGYDLDRLVWVEHGNREEED